MQKVGGPSASEAPIRERNREENPAYGGVEAGTQGATPASDE